MENVTKLLFAAVLLVVLAVIMISLSSTAESETKKILSPALLSGCCTKMISPTTNGCAGDDAAILAFECDVPKEISSAGKMGIGKVYSKANGIDENSVTADKIRISCQCPAAG